MELGERLLLITTQCMVQALQHVTHSTLMYYHRIKQSDILKKYLQTQYYPAGLIVISTSGAIPSGWVRCDGTSGTPDLRGDFAMGSATPGSTGGSTSHNHIYTQVPYHSHTMNAYGGSHYHDAISCHHYGFRRYNLDICI